MNALLAACRPGLRLCGRVLTFLKRFRLRIHNVSTRILPKELKSVCVLTHRRRLKFEANSGSEKVHERCRMSRFLETKGPSSNQLLASISTEEYSCLVPHLRRISFSRGDAIDDSTGNFAFAYFPTTCVASLVCPMADGATAEVALTGNDGLLGTSLYLGGCTNTNRAIVGISGEA